jgi:predicted amidophosphoribosyltransferase
MSHSPNGAFEYNRTCDVCWRHLTTLDDICETCEDNLTMKIQENE